MLTIRGPRPRAPERVAQSYRSRGTLTTGHKLLCKEFLRFNTMPCRHICPYLCTSESVFGMAHLRRGRRSLTESILVLLIPLLSLPLCSDLTAHQSSQTNTRIVQKQETTTNKQNNRSKQARVPLKLRPSLG